MKLLLFNCCLFAIAASTCQYSSEDVLLSPASMNNFHENRGEPSLNDRWVNFFNLKIEQIDSLYLPNAVLLSTNAEIFDNARKRKDYYAGLKNSIGTIKSIATINKTGITPDVSYEIGYFVNSRDVKFKYFVIWKRADGRFLRELELISAAKNETGDIAGINATRQRWMDWCNSHKVNELVNNTYAENAVYYTNNRLTIGSANIVKQYRYMSDPSYQLTLTPIILEAVNDSLAFEIGQCAGSYRGKYVLVWRKQNGMRWKIMLDAN